LNLTAGRTVSINSGKLSSAIQNITPRTSHHHTLTRSTMAQLAPLYLRPCYFLNGSAEDLIPAVVTGQALQKGEAIAAVLFLGSAKRRFSVVA
jgi:hypothetical protein